MRVNYAHLKPSGYVEVSFTPAELNMLVGSMTYEIENNRLADSTKQKLQSMVDKLSMHT